jgi:hypothetical protein
MSRVRTTLEIAYKDEVRDLAITFDLIDKVRADVPWEQIAVEFDKPNPVPNFTMLTKFVTLNLKYAGFKLSEEDFEEIYDEMLSDAENEGYIALIGQLLAAYMPRGRSKKSQPQQKPVKKRRTKKS